MKKFLMALLFALGFSVCAIAGQPKWRQATKEELTTVLPLRMALARDRVEIVARSRSGIIDRTGRLIAGAEIETRGYETEDQFADFFVTQVPIKIAGVKLIPGKYAFGYQRVSEDAEEVWFYETADLSHIVVKLKAYRDRKRRKLVPLEIKPPSGQKGLIYFGRFFFKYQLAD